MTQFAVAATNHSVKIHKAGTDVERRGLVSRSGDASTPVGFIDKAPVLNLGNKSIAVPSPPSKLPLPWHLDLV